MQIMARKPRDSKVPEAELLRPIDVMKFGSDSDPCFGKLYSLTADECQICGDFELCAIMFQNTLQVKRIGYEKTHAVLDMEIDKLEKEKDINDFVKRLRDKGFKGLLIRKRLRQRFMLSDELITKYSANGCKR